MNSSLLPILSLAVSGLSLTVAATTAWLTLWRRGTICMGQPPSIYFGPDGGSASHPKVFVRALLYATAARGRIVEALYARISRGDSVQTFPVWVCGEDKEALGRGVGLAVGREGLALHHHFLLPRDGTSYRFLAGVYKLDVYAVLVGEHRPMRIRTVELAVSDAQAAALAEEQHVGLYFDWSPETGRYHAHIDKAKPPSLPPPLFLFATPAPTDSLPETVEK